MDTITQFYLDCVNEDAKYDALVGLYHLMTIGQSIIFCKVSDIHCEQREQTDHVSIGEGDRRQDRGSDEKGGS